MGSMEAENIQCRCATVIILCHLKTLILAKLIHSAAVITDLQRCPAKINRNEILNIQEPD